MKKILAWLMIGSFAIFCPLKLMGQYQKSPGNISFALTNVQYGLPFYKFLPVHPGIELSTDLLKKETNFSLSTVSLSMGYFNHQKLFSSFYSTLNYQYQVQLKNTLGLGLNCGLGGMYSTFHNEGYRFNAEKATWEGTSRGKLFMVLTPGIELSYIKYPKIKPFVQYNLVDLNIWEFSIYLRTMAILNVGVALQFDHHE